MAGDEPVTAPDQHTPTNMKAARVGGVLTILILLSMTIGGNITGLERLWLVGVAALIAAILVGEWLLRKNGLRS